MSWFRFKKKKKRSVEVVKEDEWKAPPMRRNQTLVKQSEKEVVDNGMIARILFQALLVIFLGVSGYVLLFSPFLMIDKITVSGNQVIREDEIRNTITKNIDGNFLGFIPRSNFFIVSQGDLEQLIHEQYKRTRIVEVRKIFPSGLAVKVEERGALVLWCAQDNCYVTDEQGVAYQQVTAEDPMVTQNELIRIHQGSNDVIVREGERVTDPAIIQYATRIKSVFQREAEIIIADDVDSRVPRGQELVVKSVDGWQLLLDTDLSIESVALNLKAVIDKELGRKNLANLEYADLRVENKVFYKLKQQEEQNQSSPSSIDEEKPSDTKSENTKRRSNDG